MSCTTASTSRSARTVRSSRRQGVRRPQRRLPTAVEMLKRNTNRAQTPLRELGPHPEDGAGADLRREIRSLREARQINATIPKDRHRRRHDAAGGRMGGRQSGEDPDRHRDAVGKDSRPVNGEKPKKKAKATSAAAPRANSAASKKPKSGKKSASNRKGQTPDGADVKREEAAEEGDHDVRGGDGRQGHRAVQADRPTRLTSTLARR